MYLPIIIEFNISCSGVICHCIMMCSFFCRASSFFLPSITTDKPCRFVYESLLGHTLVQRNKHHSSTCIAFVSVCHRGPSTRRANPSDGESLNTRNNRKNWHPMWGLWLVAETQPTSASSRSAAQRPTAKSYENHFISAKEHQRMYDFARVADRLTQQCALPSQVLQ